MPRFNLSTAAENYRAFDDVDQFADIADVLVLEKKLHRLRAEGVDLLSVFAAKTLQTDIQQERDIFLALIQRVF